jgi:hypothetical protein
VISGLPEGPSKGIDADSFVGEVGEGGCSLGGGDDAPFVSGTSLGGDEAIVSACELMGGIASPSISDGGDIRDERSAINKGSANDLEDNEHSQNSPRHPKDAGSSGCTTAQALDISAHLSVNDVTS